MTDVMSNLGLAIYPIVAMGLFLFVFVGVIGRVMSRSAKSEQDRAAWLPLSDAAETAARSTKEAGR